MQRQTFCAATNEWLRERATIRRLKRHLKIMSDTPKNIFSAKQLDDKKWQIKRAQRGYADVDQTANIALAVIESHELLRAEHTSSLELLETLATFLAETHVLDKSNQHYGDETDGQVCSYCEAIGAARQLLAGTRGETQ